ncbi:MAG: type II toxin-antitoxin system Phd/YefM family antitoxin [Candidatus Omnitrophica bacterium]|nr:type II toxin-antitoxin system Phd/YefM family antitoxin [Candidatus Omnitrophota bacterium]
MQFIGVRDFRNKSVAIWKKLKAQKELVITSNGKPVALLSAVNESDLEQSLKALRRSKAMIAFEVLQKKAAHSGLSRMSLSDINEEIRRHRRSQRG